MLKYAGNFLKYVLTEKMYMLVFMNRKQIHEL
jgi:hypothetical protein